MAPEIPGFYFDSTRNRYFKSESKVNNVPGALTYSHRNVSLTKKRKNEQREREERNHIIKTQFIKRPHFLSQSRSHYAPLRNTDPLIWREFGEIPRPFSGFGPDGTLEVFIDGFKKVFHCVYDLQDNSSGTLLQIFWFDVTATHLVMGYRLLPDTRLRVYITRPEFPNPLSLRAREIVSPSDSWAGHQQFVMNILKWLDVRAANTPATWKSAGLFQSENAVIAVTNEPDFLPGISGREMVFSIGDLPERPWSVSPLPELEFLSYETGSFLTEPSVIVQSYTWGEGVGSWGAVGAVFPDPNFSARPPIFNTIIRFQCGQDLTASCVINSRTFAFGSRNGFVMILYADQLPKVRIKTWYHGSRPVAMSRVGDEGRYILVVGAGVSKSPFDSGKPAQITLYDLESIAVEQTISMPDVEEFLFNQAGFWWHPDFKEKGLPIWTVSQNSERPAATRDTGAQQESQSDGTGNTIALPDDSETTGGGLHTMDSGRSRRRRRRIDMQDRSFHNDGVLTFPGFTNENEETLGLAVYHGDSNPRGDGNKGFEIFAVANDKGEILIYSLLTGRILKTIEDDGWGNPTANAFKFRGHVNPSMKNHKEWPLSDNVVRSMKFQMDDRGCPRLIFARRDNIYVHQWEGNKDYRFCSEVPFVDKS